MFQIAISDNYYRPLMRCGNIFSPVCLPLYNSPTFESLGLESSLLVCRYTSSEYEYLGQQTLIIKTQ